MVHLVPSRLRNHARVLKRIYLSFNTGSHAHANSNHGSGRSSILPQRAKPQCSRLHASFSNQIASAVSSLRNIHHLKSASPSVMDGGAVSL